MTSYLGQAVFEETPTRHDVWVETKRHAGRWIWVLGVQRLAIPAMLIVASRVGQPASAFWDAAVPVTILSTAIMIRAGRPFLPEILLLERCPLKSDRPQVITASQRSGLLHRPAAGDLNGRFLATSFVLAGLFFSIFFTLISIRGLAIGSWNLMDLIVLLVLYPVALWLAAAVSVLVRFLVYLDTRIRLEGWEVELAMQAEALRQFGDQVGRSARIGTKSGLSLVLLVSLSACSATLAAESSQGENLVDDSIWFDADVPAVLPVTVKPQVDDSLNRNSRWLPKPQRVKQTANANTPASSSNGLWGTGLSISNLLGWLLLVVIVGLAIALIAKFVSQAEAPERRSGLRSKVQSELADQQMAERIKHLPAELRRTDVHLRSEAERLMKAAQYDHAIILLFGHQLLLLDHAGQLRLSRGKTNRQYVRETASADAVSAKRLRATIDSFERSYFGRHSIAKQEFDELWKSNIELERAIGQRSEEAA